jgi:predicted permease
MWEPLRRNTARLWSTVRRSRRESELQAEIDFHLETLADEYRRRGLSEKEARLAAKREFGGAEQMKETYRDRRGFPLLESVWQDVKLGIRGLRKSPAFTVVAIASLALGIGANTAIFSFVNAVLLKQLPVPEPERLVTFSLFENGEVVSDGFSFRTINEVAKQSPSFDGLLGSYSKAANLTADSASQWVIAELVTGQYFRTLKVKPALGRLLTEEDVRDAVGNPVCVLSYNLWQTRFGGDPRIVSRTISINTRFYRVLGVTEKGFYGLELQHPMDLQIPATRIADFMPGFTGSKNFDWRTNLSWLRPMGRLKPNLTRAEAESQLRTLYRQIVPDSDRVVLKLAGSSDGFNNLRGNFGKPVTVLMAVAALVLLIACANLANLLLARASARQKEFAVRLSLGAPRVRLIRQLLIESTLLAGCGGTVGILLSFWITSTLLAFLNEGQSTLYALHVSPDARVLWFAVVLSLATAILFGLMPAWQATKPDLLPGLKEEASVGLRPGDRAMLRKFLVVAQVTLSLVVLFAAGLLARTLRSLRTVDLGFQPGRVVAFTLNTDVAGHSNAQTSHIEDEVLRRVRLLPGVGAASLVMEPPLSGGYVSTDIEVPGFAAKHGDKLWAFLHTVSPGYFATIHQSRLLGRDFSDADSKGKQRVAVVNEKFAQHYFPGRSPLGQHIKQDRTDVEIIGVVANAREVSLRQQPEDAIYLPEKPAFHTSLTCLLRTQIDPSKLTPSLLALVRNVDKQTAVSSIRTLDSQMNGHLSSERILSYLSGLFAGLATLLTGIGLYGVIAYTVTRRTREIGVRFALGAQRADVAKLFLRESLAVIAVGVLLGIPLALASVTALKSLLFGLTATDLPTLSISVVLLLVAGLVATALPLRQAIYVDPLQALRYE